MPYEIERKFLVRGEFRHLAKDSTRIVQAYLCNSPDRTVRIRIRGAHGYITVKGPSSTSGIRRYEWEKEIAVSEAEELIRLCEPGAIDKIRYLIDFEGHTFEVDEFSGENAGLVMAELELKSEDEEFIRPVWLGEEVTGDERYYNAFLCLHPYKSW